MLGFCRNAVTSLAADLNRGALDCGCDREGTLEDRTNTCDKLGGQCECKPNVMGRQCTSCRPGFYGFPNCKQCTCPKTARCDETTGKSEKVCVIIGVFKSAKMYSLV